MILYFCFLNSVDLAKILKLVSFIFYQFFNFFKTLTELNQLKAILMKGHLNEHLDIQHLLY